MRKILVIVAIAVASLSIPVLAATTSLSNNIDVGMLVKAPATFVYSDLTVSPEEPVVGQNATISVRVDNTGDLVGSCSATLVFTEMPDAFTYVPQTQAVTLDAGSHDKLVFVVSPTVAGVYKVDLGGLSSTFEAVSVSYGLPWWGYALVVILVVTAIGAIMAYNSKRGASETPKLSFRDSLTLRFLKLADYFSGLGRFIRRKKK